MKFYINSFPWHSITAELLLGKKFGPISSRTFYHDLKFPIKFGLSLVKF